MPKRYFENPFPDLGPGQEIQIDHQLWKKRIQDLISAIIANDSSPNRRVDGGVYVGLSGVAYMMWYVSDKIPELNCLETAKKFAQIHYKFCQENDSKDLGSKLAFLLGNTGVYAVNAVIANSAGDYQASKSFVRLFGTAEQGYLSADPMGVGSDELFIGRAGYLTGCMWLQDKLGYQVLSEEKIFQLCDIIVQGGRKFSRRCSSKSPLMYSYYETQYLGAAHGLTGILQLLMSVPDYFHHNPEAEKDVKASIAFLLSVQTFEGNFPCSMGELKDPRHHNEELIHWCHGAPGTVYLLARAHLLWGDAIYMTAAVKAADLIWKKGLLKKGPGICHGVSGTGYVFLMMHRLTRNIMYLNRALRCAEFMFQDQFKSARTPDCPLSLYEGWSGTACFLTDLLFPDQAAFPFSEVFL